MLQAEAVVTVTRPVTQVAVVAVNKASIYAMGFPSAELMGRLKSILPIRIVIKNPRSIICVVVSLIFFVKSHPCGFI